MTSVNARPRGLPLRGFLSQQGTRTTWATAFPRTNCRATTATVLTATVTWSLRACCASFLSHLLSQVHRRQTPTSSSSSGRASLVSSVKTYLTNLPSQGRQLRTGKSDVYQQPIAGLDLVLVSHFPAQEQRNKSMAEGVAPCSLARQSSNHRGSLSTAVEAPGVERCRCASNGPFHSCLLTSLTGSFVLQFVLRSLFTILRDSFVFELNTCYSTHGHVSVFSKPPPVCLVHSPQCGYVVF